jgi:hypothetical protein
MTKKEIIKTVFEKLSRRNCSSCYKEVIGLGLLKKLLVVIRLNENNNKKQWSIVVIEPEEYKGFWMDSFNTKREAISLCTGMGWRIKND